MMGKRFFESLDAPIARVAGPVFPAIPFAPPMEDFLIVKAEKIANGVRKITAY